MILLDLSSLSAQEFNEENAPDIKAEGIEQEDLNRALVSLEVAPPRELQFEDAEDAEISNEAAGDPAGTAAESLVDRTTELQQ